MRTNLILDDKLVEEAFKYAHVSTKKELIDLVLREFVLNHRPQDPKILQGKVQIRDDYNYKSLRNE